MDSICRDSRRSIATARQPSKTDDPFAFQSQVVSRALNLLHSNTDVVLAGACGSGKTIMAIKIGRNYREELGGVVLVLTHGQKILRRQFGTTAAQQYEGAVEARNSKELVSGLKRVDQDENIWMLATLPHTAHKIPKSLLRKVTLLIVDEAHDFYFAKMVQKIIRSLPEHTAQLLLTGTPSPFVVLKHNLVANRARKHRKFEIITIPPEDVFATGATAPPRIELYSSNYRVLRKDYKGDDLSEAGQRKLGSSSSSRATSDTISYLCKRIIDSSPLLRSRRPEDGQMMFVAGSIKHGRDIAMSLHKNGIEACLSTSENDERSKHLENFQNGKIKAIVVVSRGRIGFNAPNLMLLVDLSMSRNVSLIFQTMARLYRRPSIEKLRNHEKLYIKVMPRELMIDGYATLNACIAMNLRQYFTSILDPSKLGVIARSEVLEIAKAAGTTGGCGSTQAAKNIRRNHMHAKLPSIPEMLKRARQIENLPSSLAREAYCSLADLKREISGSLRANYTKEECATVALNFKSRGRFQLGAPDEYSAAYRHGWLDEICTHMPPPTPRLTKARVIETAKPYSEISPWAKACGKAYKRAREKGWFAEATAHMTRSQRPPRTKAECRQSAGKYRAAGPTAWQKSKNKEDRGAYRTAMTQGWLDDIAIEMGWRVEAKGKKSTKKPLKAKKVTLTKGSKKRN